MYVNKEKAEAWGKSAMDSKRQSVFQSYFTFPATDLISFLSSFPIRPLSLSLLHTPTPSLQSHQNYSYGTHSSKLSSLLPTPPGLRLALFLLLLLLLLDRLLQNLSQFPRLEKRGHNIAAPHKLPGNEQLRYGGPLPKINGDGGKG